jgi:hypothetical protein
MSSGAAASLKAKKKSMKQPITGAAAYPWQKLSETSWVEWGLSAIPATLTLLVTDLFFETLLFLFFVSTLDYVVGSWNAKRAGDYDHDVARWGLLYKIALIPSMMILRWAESLMVDFGLFQTSGIIASACTFVLALSEAQSAIENIEKGTGKPVPIVGAIFGMMKRLGESLLPNSNKEE